MKSFKYASAQTIDEAIGLVGANGRFLAGGIDLLGEMKDYILEPDVLVNVKRIQQSDSGFGSLTDLAPLPQAGPAGSPVTWWLGGSVTVAQIADHPLTPELRGLKEAASHVGSTQIRNVASAAGNVLQHSRCWYYRQPDLTCLKKGGKTCPAREGENRYSALFSGNACVSPVVSNLAVILTALEATAQVRRAGKTVPMSMKEVFAEAWKTSAAHHSLQAQDFLSGFTVPLKRNRTAYRQQSDKAEFDWALASCAAAANIENGTIRDARVVLGAVANVPYMSDAANAFLEGKPLNDETVTKAADMILQDAKPLEHNGYKVPLAHTLIRRTLLALNA